MVIETAHMPSPVVEAVLQIIEDRIGAELTTASIARELGFSERQLQRIFKAETGEPVAKFIRRQRMERAARLLSSTREPVFNVAQMVGYASHSSWKQSGQWGPSVPPADGGRKNTRPQRSR